MPLRKNSDFDFGLSDEPIDKDADSESPSHVRDRQGNPADQQRDEIFFIGLEASNERAEFKTRKNQEHPNTELGRNVRKRNPASPKESAITTKMAPIISGAPPVLAPNR